MGNSGVTIAMFLFVELLSLIHNLNLELQKLQFIFLVTLMCFFCDNNWTKHLMKTLSIHYLVLGVNCHNKQQKIISFYLEIYLSKSTHQFFRIQKNCNNENVLKILNNWLNFKMTFDKMTNIKFYDFTKAKLRFTSNVGLRSPHSVLQSADCITKLFYILFFPHTINEFHALRSSLQHMLI